MQLLNICEICAQARQSEHWLVFLTICRFNYMSAFGSFVSSVLHLVPTSYKQTHRGKTVILPEVGQMGLPLLAARPQPHWWTSDSEL